MCRTFRAGGSVPLTRDHVGRRTREGQANVDGAARAFKGDGQGKSCIGLPVGPMHAFPHDSAVTGPHYMPVPRCCASGRKPAEPILVVIAIPPLDALHPRPGARPIACRQHGVMRTHASIPQRAVSDPDRSLDAYGTEICPAGKFKKALYIGSLQSFRALHTTCVSSMYLMNCRACVVHSHRSAPAPSRAGPDPAVHGRTPGSEAPGCGMRHPDR